MRRGLNVTRKPYVEILLKKSSRVGKSLHADEKMHATNPATRRKIREAEANDWVTDRR